MTILIDMDDVLEQLIPGWINYINERYGTHAVPSDVKIWDMSNAFPTLTYEQVYSIAYDPDFWDYVVPMPGAVETTRRLQEEGHELFIVTATDFRTVKAKMEKVLFRYFPHLPWNRVILTEHKQQIKGDVLIDDGPHNLVGGSYRKLLFDAPHNLTLDAASIGAVRVHSWDDVYERIQEIEASLA